MESFIQPLFEILNSQLSNTLPELLIRSVANTINLDYQVRKEKINSPLEIHMISCAQKIKSFTNKFKSENPDFKFQNNIECVLKLFCAGISNDNIEKRDKNNEQIIAAENSKNTQARSF